MNKDNPIDEKEVLHILKTSKDNNDVLLAQLKSNEDIIKQYEAKVKEYDKVVKISEAVKEEIKEPIAKITNSKIAADKPLNINEQGIFQNYDNKRSYREFARAIQEQRELIKEKKNIIFRDAFEE